MNVRRLLALALTFFWSFGVQASEGLVPSEMKTKDALHSVIAGQLAAFRLGDFAGAYVFADPGIKKQFPLERFEQMVKAGYPAIPSSVSQTFGLTFDNGDEAVVNIRVSGADRQVIAYQYLLRRDGETWRITGVVPLKEQTTEV